MGNTGNGTGRSEGTTSYITGRQHGMKGKLANFGWDKKMTHVGRAIVV